MIGAFHTVTPESVLDATMREAVDEIRGLLIGLTPEQRLPLLNHASYNGTTALTLAASTGRSEVIAALLAGLTPEQRLPLLNHADYEGCFTALIIAARWGHSEAITALAI